MIELTVSIREYPADPLEGRTKLEKILTVDEPINSATMNHHLITTNPKAISHGYTDFATTITELSRHYNRPVEEILNRLHKKEQFSLPRTRALSYLNPRMEGVTAKALSILPTTTIKRKRKR